MDTRAYRRHSSLVRSVNGSGTGAGVGSRTGTTHDNPPQRKALPRPRHLPTASRQIASLGLAVLLAGGALPAPAVAGDVTGPIADGRSAQLDTTIAVDPARPAAVPAAPDATGDDETAVPDLHPSIAYEQAMAHEHDQIEFKPGGRVAVGFTPRPRDLWPIDGHAPAALPAGRATGREMAASAQGSLWARVRGSTGVASSATDGADGSGTDSPIDGPGGRPALDASGVSWTAPPAADGVDLAAASGLRRQVFGFLPYWELSGASTKINNAVLSTIAYFSVGADRTGNLRKKDRDGTNTTGWGGWTSSNLTSVISSAHQHGTRVVLTVSVFAWTTAQANVQRALLGSGSARLTLAKQIAAAIRDRGADGVNLDFEPLASGYADEFVALLKTVRTQLNKVRKGYQLTYDTTGFIGNYPLEASVGSGAADAIFIMGYDYRTSGSGVAGSVDPMSGPAYDLADTVRAYTARVSPSRIILGLPWYGRAWSTADASARSKTLSGAKYGYSTAVNYENVTALVAKYGRRWDALERSPYVAYKRKNCTSAYGCVTSWRQVYYDDFASLKQRYAIVNDYGLRGAGMWALGYDGGHSELYRAASESFLVDKSAPQAGIRMPAATQGDEGFVVSWAARDTSGVASYDVQVSVDGGPWATWLRATRATSDVWLGADGHGYAFRVRGTDRKGNAGSWNVGTTWDASPSLATGGFGRVVADGLSYRSGPDTNAAKLGTLKAGTIVAITRGPVSSDGFTWYEVTEPIREWSPVSFVERGVWIAARSSSDTMVKPYRAANSTMVDAGIRGLNFGSGPGSALGSGPAALAIRAFSPNGDGSEDAMRLRWRNTLALDSLTLNVYRTNGSFVGSRSVPDTGAGTQSWDWNGRTGNGTVRNGRYVLQLVGRASGRTFHAPSGRPTTPAQVAAFGVTVDTVAPTVRAASASTTLISPNGDGNHDAVRLAMTSSGATRWALLVASPSGTIRTAHGTGGSIGFTLARRAGQRGAGRRWSLHRHAGRDGRGRQPGPSLVHDRRRHHRAVHRDGRGSGPAVAQRRRRPGLDAAVVVGERAGQRRHSDPQGQHGRALVDGALGVRLGHDLGRANRWRQARRRWPLHAARRSRRRRRQPARGHAPRGRGPHGGLPPLVAQLLSAGRRPARAELDPLVEAHPRREDHPAPVQRLRDARPDRVDRQAVPLGRPPVGVERPARERDVRRTGPVRGAADRLVIPGHGRACPPRLGERVRGVDLLHQGQGRPDPAGLVHDDRGPGVEADGVIQAARPRGEGRHGDSARRRLVHRVVQGAGRRLGHGRDPGLRPRHGRPPEPDDAVGPGRLLSPHRPVHSRPDDDGATMTMEPERSPRRRRRATPSRSARWVRAPG